MIAVRLIPSIVTKEAKGEYIQALIDSREQEDSTIIQDVMLAQHITNLESRILQYQQSINDTVNDESDTVNDTATRLITLIKAHPEYTYDEYAKAEHWSGYRSTSHQKIEWNDNQAYRIGQRRALGIYKRTMMTKKILFLHGFFASGSCIPAQALRQAFTGEAEVLTPDLPLHPKEALAFIENICKQEKPCVLVGNSNGAFLAQIVASRLGIPALLGNPYLEMTRFLIERIGAHEYKSLRADGHQKFVIDQLLIDEFAEVQAHEWDNSHPKLSDRIWGLFGENDHLAHFEPLFLQHYTHAYHFPGGHTPTAEEVREYYTPLVEELMLQIIKINN